MEDFKIVAVKALSNSGGLAIHDQDGEIIRDNKIMVGLYSDHLLSTHRIKVYYNDRGAYFILGGRHYLDEFMRTER